MSFQDSLQTSSSTLDKTVKATLADIEKEVAAFEKELNAMVTKQISDAKASAQADLKAITDKVSKVEATAGQLWRCIRVVAVFASRAAPAPRPPTPSPYRGCTVREHAVAGTAREWRMHHRSCCRVGTNVMLLRSLPPPSHAAATTAAAHARARAHTTPRW